jgi:hypothetical protein
MTHLHSDVGLAIRKELYHKLSIKTRNFLIGVFNEFKEETESWYLFIVNEVVWDAHSPDVRDFRNELYAIFNPEDEDGDSIDSDFEETEDITLIVNTEGYEEDDSDDINSEGGPDPWNLKRVTKVLLEWDAA